MEQNDFLEPTPLSSHEKWKYALRSPSFWGFVTVVICYFLFAIFTTRPSSGEASDLLCIGFACSAGQWFGDYRKAKSKKEMDRAAVSVGFNILFSISYAVLYILKRLKA